MRSLILSFLTIAYNLVFLMCHGQSNLAGIGGTYLLTKQLNNQKLVALEDLEFEVFINGKESQITGTVGCNSVTVDITVTGQMMNPTRATILTQTDCEGENDGSDRRFLQNTGKINRFRTEKDFLYLMRDEEILIVLKRK